MSDNRILEDGNGAPWHLRTEDNAGVHTPVVHVDNLGDIPTATDGLTDEQLRASRVGTEPLGVPGVARQLAAGAVSANTVLTAGARISITARTSDIRFSIGSTAQTASATTSHFIAAGERLDFSLPTTPNIAVIRDLAAGADGVLELTEL